MTEGAVPGSFRDPSGVVFQREGVLYRQVNPIHSEQYDLLMSSGLHEALVSDGLLIPHEEVDEPGLTAEAHRVIRPEPVGFISYPYEWSFSQLKDAALATLRIQRRAMEFGMSLRDANAYNIQFHRGRPVLIDTLSFEKLPEGKPWVAYRQFCQHFLAPLALMAFVDVRLGQLSRTHIDGVPLDLAASILPKRARRRPGLLMHIVAHARSQRKYEARPEALGERKGRFSRNAFTGVLESLASSVRKLEWEGSGTTWSQYYEEATHYSPEAFGHKQELVAKFVDEAGASTAWDLGGNVGVFARIAAERGIPTVCFDLDPGAVDANYRKVREEKETGVLPLVLDLSNPSPAIGWDNRERMSLLERGPADLGLALALVHHLAIGNNVPLPQLASFFAEVCRALIVEFVPKEDPKVRVLLASREDIFPGYTAEGFERAFGERFTIERREEIRESPRTLYLMRRR